MTPVTVLITGMGSTTAISVAKGLKRQTEFDVRIIGVDINRRDEIAGSSFCDQFYTIPEARKPEFIPALLNICATEGVQVVFPVIDVELEMIAARADAFRAKGIRAWLSDAETIRVCNMRACLQLRLRRHQAQRGQRHTWLRKVSRRPEITRSHFTIPR